MSYIDGKAVLAAASKDGKWRLEIIQRPEGQCRFIELFRDPGDEYSGPYWRPTHESGLYPDLATAKAEASIILHWLKQPN